MPVLKVLHATPSYAPAYKLGGPIRSLEGLLPELIKRGVAVRVLTTDCDGPERLEVPIGWHLRDGIPVKYARRWAAPDLTPTYFLDALLEARSADVVHVTGVFSAPVVEALEAARIARNPVVLSPRGALEDWALSARSNAKKKAWLRLFAGAFRAVSAFHVTAEQEGESVRRVFGAAVDVRVIPNGTVLPVIGSDEEDDASASPVIGSIGRVQRKKALERLVLAASLLSKKGVDFRLWLAGPVEEPDYLKEIHKLVAETGLTRQVRIDGELLGEKKDEFFRGCRIFALPSHSENFGNVVVEALARKVPVVASRGTPWADLETAGCGRWVENSPESLAAALEPYLTDKRMARNAGEVGRHLVESRYTWPGVAEAMLSVYRELAGR